MKKWRRGCCDRRVGGDRRQVHSLDYFAAGGIERRGGATQRKRKGGEKRRNWVRVDRYVSVYCGWSADDVNVAEGIAEEPTLTIYPAGVGEGREPC